MRDGTSGLMFTKNIDGSIILEVVDYGVSEFGGGDWESSYRLDKKNAQLLYNELKKLHKGSFNKMLIEEFGETFRTIEFEAFCRERNIKYSHTSWTSWD